MCLYSRPCRASSAILSLSLTATVWLAGCDSAASPGAANVADEVLVEQSSNPHDVDQNSGVPGHVALAEMLPVRGCPTRRANHRWHDAVAPSRASRRGSDDKAAAVEEG